MSEELLTPYTFRLITLILEKIERHKLSLDKAFHEITAKYKIKQGEKRFIYVEAWKTLLNFGIAEYILESNGYKNLPLRRKNAFRTAFSFIYDNPAFYDKIKFVRGGLIGNKLYTLLSPRNIEKAEDKVRSLPVHARLSYFYSFPQYILRRLLEKLDSRRVEHLLQSFKKRYVWLRIIDKNFENEILLKIRKDKINYKRDDLFEDLYHLYITGFQPLPQLPYQIAVYQDKASVAVVRALLVQKSEKRLFLDAAAAPGMKTILYCLDRSEETMALDISYKRLSEAKQLVSSFCKMAHFLATDSSFVVFRGTIFSNSLVDAPCTNSGAINRDPGLRLALWNLNEKVVKEYSLLQYKILENVIKHLMKGGVIAYSTCSLLPEEGENVIEKILLNHDVDLLDFPYMQLGELGYKNYSFRNKVRRTFPDIDRTSSFFIALLRKN